MKTWLALFRGINVGGRNSLSMADLSSDLESLGLKQIQIYIQSGNVVFNASAKSNSSLSRKIGEVIEANHGFRPQVFLIDRDELQDAVDSNPFPKAAAVPETLHFFFLAKPASQPDLASIERVKSSSESFQLNSRVFYLHAPDGIGRSKLAASAEKHLGVPTTARNYRTVARLLLMMG